MTDVQSGGSKSREPVGVVYAVPEGKRISVGAPSLIALANGKLLAAFDQTGPDVKGLAGKKGHDAKRNRWMQGLVMCSGDGGATWQRVAAYPYRRASLFRDGGDVYLLGEAAGGLCLMRSPDGGSSWSAPMELTGDLDVWLSPTAVVAAGDSWLVTCLAPSGGDLGLMVWRAPRGASLMNRKAWTQGPVSPPLADFAAQASPGASGVPWPGAAPAWRHPVAVHVAAAQHPWHRDGDVHVLATAGCGREHWGAVMRVAATDLTVSVQDMDGGGTLVVAAVAGRPRQVRCLGRRVQPIVLAGGQPGRTGTGRGPRRRARRRFAAHRIVGLRQFGGLAVCRPGAVGRGGRAGAPSGSFGGGIGQRLVRGLPRGGGAEPPRARNLAGPVRARGAVPLALGLIFGVILRGGSDRVPAHILGDCRNE
jgi:hypothetical protein